jgi:23S rRNA (cytidine2498-2'-O)-methyltransferase
MKKPFESGFIFAVTNPGSERALKLEVEMAGLDWRPGYQRKGFVTFKAAADGVFDEESILVPLGCARRLCLSLGKHPTVEAAEAAIREALGAESPIHHGRFAERKMAGISGGAVERIGKWVGTVVGLGAEEFWAGAHRHERFLSPDPAGDPRLAMPVESPSRAWLKLEEAVRFFGLHFGRQDIVVELGASPGGVVLALLNRGASVIGVDPAKMAEVVVGRSVAARDAAAGNAPWFYHCRKPAALVGKKDLGQGVTWFMSDMNQSPEVVLTECARIMKMAPSIRGALITLKLTDLMEVAGKDQWFSALSAMGFRTIRLQQFSAHHREFALLGIR